MPYYDENDPGIKKCQLLWLLITLFIVGLLTYFVVTDQAEINIPYKPAPYQQSDN